jgi:hypothetical protein
VVGQPLPGTVRGSNPARASETGGPSARCEAAESPGSRRGSAAARSRSAAIFRHQSDAPATEREGHCAACGVLADNRLARIASACPRRRSQRAIRSPPASEDGRSFRVPELLRVGLKSGDPPAFGFTIGGRTIAYYIVFLASVALFLGALRIVNLALRTRVAGDPRERSSRRGAGIPHRCTIAPPPRAWRRWRYSRARSTRCGCTIRDPIPRSASPSCSTFC